VFIAFEESNTAATSDLDDHCDTSLHAQGGLLVSCTAQDGNSRPLYSREFYGAQGHELNS